ncbi:hypothetical protein HYH03_010688 [Edaphochlamys debaryana]|uniref:Uncharacterized protein n=1 Tax=Edaphochlamys debaryana TaxID=47281 RepID=A0A835XZ01_9CHLO|nr:hypothetical protein HYH03_010688 [Edaphochlamys debaryana]|eukprot:KAG2491016.1 hypothetical protein HYH03_010688 [Edaphochlamys debaryana]
MVERLASYPPLDPALPRLFPGPSHLLLLRGPAAGALCGLELEGLAEWAGRVERRAAEAIRAKLAKRYRAVLARRRKGQGWELQGPAVRGAQNGGAGGPLAEWEWADPYFACSVPLIDGVQALPAASALLLQCCWSLDSQPMMEAVQRAAQAEAVEVEGGVGGCGAAGEGAEQVRLTALQLLPDAWNAAAAAGVGLWERLEWAVRVRDVLAELPPRVQLRPFPYAD